MAKKLILLRNVPDDEANEMRNLLQTHDIDFHETSAGLIGIGTAAIWVNDEAQFSLAKQLIDDYQQQRFERARENYQSQIAAGQQLKLSDKFRQNPIKFILYCLFALGLILLTTTPFWP